VQQTTLLCANSLCQALPNGIKVFQRYQVFWLTSFDKDQQDTPEMACGLPSCPYGQK